MKKLVACLVAALLVAGCSTITKVEGEQVLRERLSLKVDSAWNKVAPPGSRQPYDTWTQEGIYLDELRIWSAVKPGEALIEAAPVRAGADKAVRVPRFAAGMAPEQLVAMFEMVYAVDGSLVELTRVVPATFAGGPGLRFEFSVVRQDDGLQLLGVGWLRVQDGQLYAACFVAPRLSFFARLAPKADALVATATLRP